MRDSSRSGRLEAYQMSMLTAKSPSRSSSKLGHCILNILEYARALEDFIRRGLPRMVTILLELDLDAGSPYTVNSARMSTSMTTSFRHLDAPSVRHSVAVDTLPALV